MNCGREPTPPLIHIDHGSIYTRSVQGIDDMLKDFKNAQFVTDCISDTSTCRDKIFISETRNVLFFEIRSPAGRKTFICLRNFDVNLEERSQIYGVSMIKRIQTSCCDFDGFKTCKNNCKKCN